MPNTGHATMPKIAVVMARLIVKGEDCGIFPFLFTLRTADGLREGVRVVPLPHRAGAPVDHGLTSFDQVELPFESLICNHATLQRDGTFYCETANIRQRFLYSVSRVQTGKICLSMYAIGHLHGALSILTRYLRQRLTFSIGVSQVPVSVYRYLQEQLAVHFSQAYAYTFWLNDLSNQYVQSLDEDRLFQQNYL